jgi:hypothetical protein
MQVKKNYCQAFHAKNAILGGFLTPDFGRPFSIIRKKPNFEFSGRLKGYMNPAYLSLSNSVDNFHHDIYAAGEAIVMFSPT